MLEIKFNVHTEEGGYLLRTILIAFVCMGVLACLPAGAEEAAGNESWFQKVDINGFLSTSYSYNFNKPESGQNQFRVFDFDDNSFKVDVFELVVQKPVANPGDAGFRVDLTAGASLPRVTASAGLFRNPDGTGEDFDLQQGFVSYIAPAGNGLRLDFGKFITHTGAEVIEGYDGFNDQYSRSFLFGFAIPFTHTGLKASYSFNPKVSAMVMLANGWDNVKDNNRGKTFGGQLTLAPSGKFTAYLNYCGGPERADSGDARQLFDAVAVWKPTGRMTFTVNYDFANENNGAGPGTDATWKGVAGYARFSINEKTAIGFRAETFDDEDGVRTGTAQRLSEFTITPEFRCGPHFVFRTDLRFDHSNEDVFDDNGNLSDNQTTIAFNSIFLF